MQNHASAGAAVRETLQEFARLSQSFNESTVY
jgi:hypothetical protein